LEKLAEQVYNLGKREENMVNRRELGALISGALIMAGLAKVSFEKPNTNSQDAKPLKGTPQLEPVGTAQTFDFDMVMEENPTPPTEAEIVTPSATTSPLGVLSQEHIPQTEEIIQEAPTPPGQGN
jgi:hypothetical protein